MSRPTTKTIHTLVSHLLEEGLSAPRDPLFYNFVIQKVMMVDIVTFFTVWVGKMVVEYPPHLFLGLVQAWVASRRGLGSRWASLLSCILILNPLTNTFPISRWPKALFEVLVACRILTPIEILFVLVISM